MEQDHADDRLLVVGLLHAGAAHQQGRDGKLAHLGMGAVGGEGTDVLQVDQLAPAGQHGGEHHGDHPGPVHVDARRVGHGAALAHGAHVLA